MKVSIIIPIYNVEKYVERCLRSVMAQTYGDIECLLVDDCTPDGSMAICERMLAEYVGPIDFKVLHHERNRGLSAARNTGTAAAMGKYIYYLDSDDEITPDCIALLVAEAEKHPGVEMVIGNRVGDELIDLGEAYCFRGRNYYEDNAWFLYQSYRRDGNIPVTAWNKLLNKDFLLANDLSFLEGILAEDQLWSFYVGEVVHRFAFVSSHTYIYHPTPYSITNGTSFHRMADTWQMLLNIMLPQVNGSMSLLQTCFFMRRFLDFYHGIPRRNYQRVITCFFKLFFCSHKYLFAAVQYIFFRFNLSLKLRKFEPSFIRWFDRIYKSTEEKFNVW